MGGRSVSSSVHAGIGAALAAIVLIVPGAHAGSSSAGRSVPNDAGRPRIDSAPTAPREHPNIVIVFTDDQGWGDLGCFGSTEIPTPHIDRLANEGVRLSDFYVSQPVCSASRASLLTGCYANRVGIAGALGPAARHGLHPEETTIAELVKPLGYATACFGKWHLGHRVPFLPTRQGFDTFEGLPYSNDMWPGHPVSPKAWPPLPWIVDEEPAFIVEDLVGQDAITRRLTERAVGFIRANAERPFLLYLAHPMPHVPLGVGPRFRSTTKYGPYGDVIREIDWSVGELRAALEETGTLDDTLFIFTSDNGPWLNYGDHAGTTGGLREGKGTTFEGGVRVPFVARLPGVIPAGSTSAEPCMTIDVLPTIAELVEAPLPERTIDGRSILPILRGDDGARSPHEALFFWYRKNELQAMRAGRWKLHFPHGYRTLPDGVGGNNGVPVAYDYSARIELALFDLESDPAESIDVRDAHPDVVERLERLADAMRTRLGDTRTGTAGSELREPGRLPE